MPEKIWDPKNCVQCSLFPAACPYMGPDLKSLLCAAVETHMGKAGIESLEKQVHEATTMKGSGCQGDCDECTLPDWMKNC